MVESWIMGRSVKLYSDQLSSSGSGSYSNTLIFFFYLVVVGVKESVGGRTQG